VNQEQAHRELITALRGIANGKGLADSVPTYGASVKIGNALENAAIYLKEDFHPDGDMGTVDAALQKLGLVRTSNRKDDIAQTLLAHLHEVP
jgi:hypothetical protein